MRTAANYCLANGFTWDGIIAERVNLREWIFQNATYNMLDFIIEGGRFSLVPALLHTTDYVIDKLRSPTSLPSSPTATCRTPSQLPAARRPTAIHRCCPSQEIGNGFPVTRGVTISLSPNKATSLERTQSEFDLSDSVPASPAERFAKFALRIRQSVTHPSSSTSSTKSWCRTWCVHQGHNRSALPPPRRLHLNPIQKRIYRS